jgi:hypothetical protein
VLRQLLIKVGMGGPVKRHTYGVAILPALIGIEESRSGGGLLVNDLTAVLIGDGDRENLPGPLGRVQGIGKAEPERRRGLAGTQGQHDRHGQDGDVQDIARVDERLLGPGG